MKMKYIKPTFLSVDEILVADIFCQSPSTGGRESLGDLQTIDESEWDMTL